MNRRGFCTITGSALASLALSMACRRSWANLPNEGRLSARPREPRMSIANSALGEPFNLGLDHERDAILYLPKSATKSPLPLMLFLHGATQSAEDMF